MSPLCERSERARRAADGGADNWVNTLSLLVQLPSNLYLVYFTNLVLVLEVELALGVDPTRTGCAPLGGRLGLPPPAFRLLFRTLFVGSQVLLAEVLLAGRGDTVLAVQSLAGAVGMVGERPARAAQLSPTVCRNSKRQQGWRRLDVRWTEGQIPDGVVSWV